jgi:hypothetical protein
MGGARQVDRSDVLVKPVWDLLQPLHQAGMFKMSGISKLERLRLHQRHYLVDQWPNSVLKRISSSSLELHARLKICKLGKDFVPICYF